MTVSNADARKLLAGDMSEKDFQGWLVTTARMLGWLAFHPLDSRGSESGYPDTTLVRDGQLIFAELKTMRGTPSASQQRWLNALKAAGASVYVWKPDQLDEILEILR